MAVFGKIRTKMAFLTILGAIITGLIIAELIVRISDTDWIFIQKNLYYQIYNLPVFQPDPDPRILFRPKPGAHFSSEGQYGPYTVTINSLGVRGTERTASKPAGVFRILCFGGSNVYGFDINDNQTWPSRLETRLNEKVPRRFEVWNMGVPAYVGIQMGALAEEAIKNYDPDLIVLAPSNSGPFPFLKGYPVASYFNLNKEFWKLLMPEETMNVSKYLSGETSWFLFRNIRFYRQFILFQVEKKKTRKTDRFSGEERLPNEVESKLNWKLGNSDFDRISNRTIRQMVENNGYPGKSKFCFFVGPYELCMNPILPDDSQSDNVMESWMHELKGNSNTPTFVLSGEGKSGPWISIHPPPETLDWYAVEFSKWLIEQKLVPDK